MGFNSWKEVKREASHGYLSSRPRVKDTALPRQLFTQPFYHLLPVGQVEPACKAAVLGATMACGLMQATFRGHVFLDPTSLLSL